MSKEEEKMLFNKFVDDLQHDVPAEDFFGVSALSGGEAIRSAINEKLSYARSVGGSSEDTIQKVIAKANELLNKQPKVVPQAPQSWISGRDKPDFGDDANDTTVVKPPEKSRKPFAWVPPHLKQYAKPKPPPQKTAMTPMAKPTSLPKSAPFTDIAGSAPTTQLKPPARMPVAKPPKKKPRPRSPSIGSSGRRKYPHGLAAAFIRGGVRGAVQWGRNAIADKLQGRERFARQGGGGRDNERIIRLLEQILDAVQGKQGGFKPGGPQPMAGASGQQASRKPSTAQAAAAGAVSGAGGGLAGMAIGAAMSAMANAMAK